MLADPLICEIIFREAGNGKFKTYEEGLQCSKDIKAAGYVESSALLNEGIHNVSIGVEVLDPLVMTHKSWALNSKFTISV